MAGTSYTRQSTFDDGDVITAALFNNEYNQLLNAFVYSATGSTGHQHDGGAGEGGNIEIVGDQDFLNKLVVDTTNNRWGFFVEVSSSAVEQIRVQDGAIVPVTNNDIDLGTSSLEFKNAYFDGIVTSDSFVGPLTGDVTGNVSGTAATVTTAAQSNITSLGTLTTLTVDNVIINGTTIGHTSDTDLLTLTSGVLTVAGELDAASLDIEGDADINGTLEADAITVDGTDLNEYIADTVGAMVGSNTESGITVAYQDSNNTLDFTVGTLNQNTTGTAATVTDAAQTNITSLGTLTTLTVDNIIINGTTIGHTGDTDLITLASGIATVAGELSVTTLDIGGINVTSTAAELNILDGKAFLDEDGLNSDSATGIASQQSIKAYVDSTVATGTAAEGIQDVVGAMFSSNTETGITVTYQDSNGTIDLVVGTLNQDTTGTAATVTGAAQANITSLGTLTTLAVDNITIDGNTISTTDTNGNLTIAPNGTGNVNVNTDSLAIAGAEGEAATLRLQSDESDDNGDEWSFISNTDQSLTIQNNISGSSVAQMTLTPHATVASSTTAIVGLATVGGTLGVTGVLTANAGVVVDEMTLDGDTLTATDDFIIDAVGDIILDADGGDLIFKDGGTEVARFSYTAGDLKIDGIGDIILDADGGDIVFQDAGVNKGTILWSSGGDLTLKSLTQNADMYFKGMDGASSITALTIDMSEEGAATFNSSVTATAVNITAQGDLRLQDASGGQYAALQAPATIGTSYTLTLPADDGDADQVLSTNGSGVLDWVTSGGLYNAWLVKTADGYTALSGDQLIANHATTAFTITLPASPSQGDTVIFKNVGAALLTVGRAGEKIDGVAENATMPTGNAVQLVFTDDAAIGWAII